MDNPMSAPPPIALTISGSDCSAGAGLQADLKTFACFRVHGLTVVTSVMAETPLEVRGLHGVEASVVEEQARVLLEWFPIGAVKTGVMHSGAHVRAVARALDDCKAPLVTDPAMLTATGQPLLAQDAINAFQSLLFPAATLMTPNLREARYLVGGEHRHKDDSAAGCASFLHEKFGCAVLVTGEHNEAAGTVVDTLADGEGITQFDNPWVELPYAHGTGCTFSSAITAGLAKGRPLRDAIAQAEKFIQHALHGAYRWQYAGREVLALDQLPAKGFDES